jgi:hypothetical protein
MKIIKMWNYAWDNYMMKVRADKFWHHIAFLYFVIALLIFPTLNLYSAILLTIFAIILFSKGGLAIKGYVIVGILILIGSFAFESGIITLVIASEYAIGKELWDKVHGRKFDFGDLMADAIGVFLAYMINGMYINLLA